LGKNAEIQVFYRKTINEIMIDTVATGATYRDSSLGALRLTVAGAEAGRLQALLEVSNAKRNSGVQSDAVFKYAVGFDLRIHPGVWLEFRYGRGRTLSNASLENRGMVSLNLSPTCALLQKCVGG
jgi:hypothetical protein